MAKGRWASIHTMSPIVTPINTFLLRTVSATKTTLEEGFVNFLREFCLVSSPILAELLPFAFTDLKQLPQTPAKLNNKLTKAVRI